MCFKVGQQIDANEEAKTVSRLHTEVYDDLWQLIRDCNRALRQEQKRYWERLRKCYPELDDYEIGFDFQTNVITILFEKEEASED